MITAYAISDNIVVVDWAPDMEKLKQVYLAVLEDLVENPPDEIRVLPNGLVAVRAEDGLYKHYFIWSTAELPYIYVSDKKLNLGKYERVDVNVLRAVVELKREMLKNRPLAPLLQIPDIF